LEAVMHKAMRRCPQSCSQDPVQLVRDGVHDDTLDLALFDLSPEPPMGEKAALKSIQTFAVVRVCGRSDLRPRRRDRRWR